MLLDKADGKIYSVLIVSHVSELGHDKPSIDSLEIVNSITKAIDVIESFANINKINLPHTTKFRKNICAEMPLHFYYEVVTEEGITYEIRIKQHRVSVGVSIDAFTSDDEHLPF